MLKSTAQCGKMYVSQFYSTWEDIDDSSQMQDSSPPWFAIVACESLNVHILGWWMRRRGPHDWATKRLDLTPCDIFLWCWLNKQVYSIKPTTLEETVMSPQLMSSHKSSFEISECSSWRAWETSCKCWGLYQFSNKASNPTFSSHYHIF